MNLTAKQIFIFDLDGTIAESRLPIEPPMPALMAALALRGYVAIVSGASLPQIREQFLDRLPPVRDGRLYLLPEGGNQVLVCREGMALEPVARHDLTPEQKAQVRAAFAATLAETGFALPAGLTLDDVLIDKGGQMTFSALGLSAPLPEKSAWDPSYAKRRALRDVLAPKIPGFVIRIGGTTSLDVTPEGRDKAGAVVELLARLGIPKEAAVYFGDALCEECNDYPVLGTGVEVAGVSGPAETQKILEAYLGAAPQA